MIINYKALIMKKYIIIALPILLLIIPSCASLHYLPLPSTIDCPVVSNTGTFGVQNMDGNAKVENKDIVCHYSGFDVKYVVSNEFVISMQIINNSNRDLLIDKSQCYVLYNGNAIQLFKDVRMTGSTTFNDIKGAINSVQTSHGSVIMTLPSYSKWELHATETNIRSSKVPSFIYEEGLYSLSALDNPEPVEFIIPYTYDGTMRKWDTCRNRIYVSRINVSKSLVATRRIKNQEYVRPDSDLAMVSTNQYTIIKQNGSPDFSEFNRINDINQETFRKHEKEVRTGRIIGAILTLPTIGGPVLFGIGALAGCIKDDHYPPK